MNQYQIPRLLIEADYNASDSIVFVRKRNHSYADDSNSRGVPSESVEAGGEV